MKLISRDRAKNKKLSRFFTGIRCLHGHLCERFVCNGDCVDCHKIRRRNWVINNYTKVKKYNRRRYKLNPKYFKEICKMWRQKNRAYDRTRINKWRKENKEAIRAFSANRRSRERNAKGNFNKDNILHLFGKQKGKCAASNCRTNLITYHVDHVKPLVRGGSNWPRNLQLLCPSCNASKGIKTMQEWVQ